MERQGENVNKPMVIYPILEGSVGVVGLTMSFREDLGLLAGDKHR